MWYQDLTWWTILHVYLIWIVTYFLLKIILNNKRSLATFIFMALSITVVYLSEKVGMIPNQNIYQALLVLIPSIVVVIAAPDLRLTFNSIWKENNRKEAIVMGSERTKQEIIEATLYLAKNKIGALITIEKHNTLDQFSNKAIMMNSEVSREVLVNIFTPNTPLHDGAVIIRGDKILCAGAYFTLSSNENFEKTTGSRHRAGLGISEVSDSMTIVVSEETGSISIAIEGIMLKTNDRAKLQEYLNMFMK
ncbi:MAG: hypothetical protein GX312_00605 [Candidatus Phytoplasma sp.]|nr:hypothetical protein [Phytoplasma sp.]